MADSIFSHAAKAIEIEDIEARVAELERAAGLAKGELKAIATRIGRAWSRRSRRRVTVQRIFDPE
jgi:hypothetical protein